MNNIPTPEFNNMTTTVSFDMLAAIDEMAEDSLREINWAENANGMSFYKDRTDSVLFKLQGKLQMLRQMIANVNVQ
jgi:hypothetical protein